MGRRSIRQPPDVLTNSIEPGSGSSPSAVSNTPTSDSEPRISARIVAETRSAARVSTKTTWSINSALPASSHEFEADWVRNCRAARCRLAGSAVAFRNSRNSTSGSMPGVGLGRFVGAGCSTVPIACGADELGTPAQPASNVASNISRAIARSRRTPTRSIRRARVVADARWGRAQSVPGSVVSAAERVSWATGWW